MHFADGCNSKVPRYRLPTHPLLQLPQLAQMPRLHQGHVHGRGGLSIQGGLQAELVQVRGYGLIDSWVD